MEGLSSSPQPQPVMGMGSVGAPFNRPAASAEPTVDGAGIKVTGCGAGVAPQWPYAGISGGEAPSVNDIMSRYTPSYYSYYDADGAKKTLLLPYPKPIIMPTPLPSAPINPNIMLVKRSWL
jgi:hypothetical protein